MLPKEYQFLSHSMNLEAKNLPLRFSRLKLCLSQVLYLRLSLNLDPFGQVLIIELEIDELLNVIPDNHLSKVFGP